LAVPVAVGTVSYPVAALSSVEEVVAEDQPGSGNVAKVAVLEEVGESL